MTMLFEDNFPYAKYQGFHTAKDVTMSGTVAFSGVTTGLRITPELIAGHDTLLSSESGKIVIATKGSATQTFTLLHWHYKVMAK